MADRSQAVRYITRVSNKIRREFDIAPTFKEISVAEARTLYFLLDRKEPTYQKDIEYEYCLRPPSASRLLARMEEHGFIKRESIEEDGRYKRITVTDKGLKYKDEVLKKLRRLEAKVTDGLTDEDIEVFCRVMKQMTDNLP